MWMFVVLKRGALRRRSAGQLRLKLGFLCGNLFARTDSSAFTGIKFVGCVLDVYKRSYAENYNLKLGNNDYFGVFGNVEDGKFTINAADRGLTVKVNGVIQTLS